MGISEPAEVGAGESGRLSSTVLPWQRKHILDLDDFAASELDQVFETTDAMLEILGRQVKKVPTLRGKIVATVFFEPSTRTRASFELAARNLGADVIGFDPGKSSVTKGESLVNTLRTLQALGTDVVVMRHSQSGAPYEATRNCGLHVVNAGDGWHAHPSQSLLDMYTMRRHFGQLEGRSVVIVGDILHSRVARSNIWGLSLAGCKVILCGPPTLLPTGLRAFLNHCNLENVSIEYSLERAIQGADVVMPLRLQLERQQSGLLSSIREYVNLYQITAQRMALANPQALVMHPGPINENIEISSGVAHGPQSVIEEQVSNGLAVRMALLYLITGGERRQ